MKILLLTTSNMRPKSYSYKRIPRFRTEDATPVQWKPNSDNLRTTKERLERTGSLSYPQYMRIWNGERPELGPGIGISDIIGTQGKLNAEIDRKGYGYLKDQPNFRGALNATMLYPKERKNPNQILHTLTNINGILHFMKIMNAKPTDVLFDGELMVEMDLGADDKMKYLRPDAVIMNGNRIVFLETDMGTHIYETLAEKAEMYTQFIQSGTLQKIGFTEISVVIHSYSRRIVQIQKKNCMQSLGKYAEYLDFLDNAFNYMSQSGYGAVGDYEDLNRAILKAGKGWGKSLSKQGINPETIQREATEFTETVTRLLGIIEERRWGDSIDMIEPNDIDISNEKQLRERELAVELWIKNDDGESKKHQ